MRMAHRPPQVKDIVIPVLGLTGSGKSTFVNYVIGPEKEQMKVGGDTTSCTTKPCPAYVDIPIPRLAKLEGHRLVLLDTPGFDDTFVEDVAILKGIAEWLADSRRQGALVGGVLYLHDISNKRSTSTSLQNLERFTHLCGEVSMKKAVLVTTNWSDTGDKRERESKLKEKDQRERELKAKHWKDIIQKGGKVQRFLQNQESAWDIINNLLESDDLGVPLLLLKELVDDQISFSETKAGRHAVSAAEKTKEGENKQKKVTRGLGCVIQ